MTPTATQGQVTDLAEGVAAGENYSFLRPAVSGSVLNGQQQLTASGTALANVDVDLKAMLDLVAAYRPGCAW